MKKIVIIGVYFGRFPNNFELWLQSCKYNDTIDFKIFTDQEMNNNIKNIEFINFDIKALNQLIKKKIGEEFSIAKPYKCCDYKVAYGLIFEDYIRGYDFWGHCDFDLIFGDIRKYLTDELLDKYDKVLSLGHLSFYRNTIDVNERFKKKGSKVGEYNEVFKSDKNYAFDELDGIVQIYKHNNYPIFEKRIFADISIKKNRFTLAMKDINYKNQIFYWENGHIYRAYLKGKKIYNEEFIYIHFKQRKNLKDQTSSDNKNAFYICNQGFISKKSGMPTLEDIKKYNKYPGIIYEKYEDFKYSFSNKIKGIKKRISK